MINRSNGVELNVFIPRVVDKTGLTGVYEFTLGFAGINIIVQQALPPATGRKEDPPGGATVILPIPVRKRPDAFHCARKATPVLN